MKKENKYSLLTPLLVILITELAFGILAVLFFMFVLDYLPGFRLERPWALSFLVLIPMLYALYFLALIWRRRKLKVYPDFAFFRRNVPEFSAGKSVTKVILLRFAIFFLIIALANPQVGTRLEEVKQQGIDMVIALDVSNSMMAEDLKPNRLEKAKLAIQRLIDNLHSERIGIVVFGGEAYTQLPITTDYAAAQLFSETITTDMIPTQGTAIGSAIELASKSFSEDSPGDKVIIVISDGENHEDDAVQAAEDANNKGIRVYTIGIGSPDGVPIPVYRGSQRTDFMRDADNNMVLTKLNEKMLLDVAAAGGGKYIMATKRSTGLQEIVEDIAKMKETEYGSYIYKDHISRFAPALFLSLIFLLVEMFISARKSWLAKTRLLTKHE